MPAKFVICPTCKAEVPVAERTAYFPFCSERCKLIDLGEWATEKFRVEAVEAPDEKHEPQE